MAKQLLGTAATTALGDVPKGYVDARTPQITVATTAPASPAVNDIWVDAN